MRGLPLAEPRTISTRITSGSSSSIKDTAPSQVAAEPTTDISRFAAGPLCEGQGASVPSATVKRPRGSMTFTVTVNCWPVAGLGSQA